MKKIGSFNVRNIRHISGYRKIEIAHDFNVDGVSTAKDPENNTVLFYKKLSANDISRLRSVRQAVIIIRQEDMNLIDAEIGANNLVLPVQSPRKEYARILGFIIANQAHKDRQYKTVDNFVIVGENVTIGRGTIIQPFVFIDHDVTIGENCLISAGVKIGQCVEIADHTNIGFNSVIGGLGFGFEREEGDGTPIHIPQIGGIRIGSHVEVGAMSSIAQGTINPTIIEDHVKIDDHVFLAHNCHIGRGSFVIACAEVSGSVVVGKNSWIGPNSAIINGVEIGEDCTVGIGSVVVKSVPGGKTVAGNPADDIETVKQFRVLQKNLLTKFATNHEL